MKERRGMCPACGLVKSVTARGVMRLHLSPRHPEDRRQYRDACSGTGEPPKSYVDDESERLRAELDAALKVVTAADAWRDDLAASRALAEAVDEWRASRAG